MGSINHAPRHQQISWTAAVDTKQLVPVIQANEDEQTRDRTVFAEVDLSTQQPGIDPLDEIISPHPILSDKSFLTKLQDFHDILVKAVVNIVDRWWEDSMDFPSRMPLETPVEDVLKVSEHNKLCLFSKIRLFVRLLKRGYAVD